MFIIDNRQVSESELLNRVRFEMTEDDFVKSLLEYVPTILHQDFIDDLDEFKEFIASKLLGDMFL